MPDDNTPDETPDIESLLRRTLSERAGQAPGSGMLEQRTLAAVRRGPARRHRPIWLVPVSVAAAVIVVVGATVGGVALVNNVKSGRSSSVGAITTGPHPSASSSPPSTVSPTTGPSATTSTPDGTPQTDSGATRTAPVGPPGGAVPLGFQVSDLTFVSPDEGWALGTATCTKKPCTSMVRTTDGGKTWRGIPAPVAGLQGVDGCTSACVDGVRFANPLIGYVFGADVLYETSDGGAHWADVSGGAVALEISGGTALRVMTANSCSPPGCSYLVQTSPIGSTTWHTVLTAKTAGTSVAAGLVRAGAKAFVQVYGHTAGGASSADSALYSSTDNGRHWTARGEACPKLAGSTGEVDATALTPAPFGSVTVLCTSRGASTNVSYTATSSDDGKTFAPGQPFALGAPIGAISAKVVLAQGQNGTADASDLLRSTNGGKTWTVVADAGAVTSPGSTGFLGFENKTTGRWVPAGHPNRVWTTTDGGANWTPFTFPG